MKRIKLCNLVFLGLVVLSMFGLFASCTDPGTTEKFTGCGSDSAKIKPCIINGDTLELYQYYYATGSAIWIAKSKNYSTTNLTYRVGKHDESVIILNGDPYRRIQGTVIMENDSMVLIKKKL